MLSRLLLGAAACAALLSAHAVPLVVEEDRTPLPDVQAEAPAPAPRNEIEVVERDAGTGIASWYGPRFHGKRTASGEKFDQEELTAAHRTLPFGTIVRVESLANGRTVDVRINDRGPFLRKRIIDLSRKAAEALGLIQARTGTKPVRIKVLEPKQDKAEKKDVNPAPMR